MDYSLPGYSVHGIFQARVPEWVPFPSPGDLPDPGIKPRFPALQADALTSEPQSGLVLVFANYMELHHLSLVAQRLKRLPAMRETWVQSLGREDPLEKEMATHSTILAWRIPWTEEPGGLQSTGSQRVGRD